MKNKVAAAVLAFAFGWFGAHKFYLGRGFQGLLFIVFFWTGIPAIIAMLEGIILITMDDREFDARYNYRYYGTRSYNFNEDLHDIKRDISEILNGRRFNKSRSSKFDNSKSGIYCQNCGEKCDEKYTFCPNCGEMINV